jgi:hypothetical protein
MLKKIFGPKRNEITEEWRRLHNEELYDTYSSPYVIWATRLRRTRWVGRVACMAERTMCIGFCWRHPRKRAHLGGLGEEGRIILK